MKDNATGYLIFGMWFGSALMIWSQSFFAIGLAVLLMCGFIYLKN